MIHNNLKPKYLTGLSLILTITLLIAFRAVFTVDPTSILERVIDFTAETLTIILSISTVYTFLSQDTETI